MSGRQKNECRCVSRTSASRPHLEAAPPSTFAAEDREWGVWPRDMRPKGSGGAQRVTSAVLIRRCPLPPTPIDPGGVIGLDAHCLTRLMAARKRPIAKIRLRFPYAPRCVSSCFASKLALLMDPLSGCGSLLDERTLRLMRNMLPAVLCSSAPPDRRGEKIDRR